MTASINMKLVLITTVLVFLSAKVKSQNHRHDFSFPPHFQTPSSGVFTSDSSIYLPPENPSPVPYFSVKNANLPFQYLPPTGTKAPAIYPTPFPMISSSFVPSFDDEEVEDDDYRRNNQLSSPQPPQSPNEPQQFSNRSYGNPAPPAGNRFEKQEQRMLPKTVSYQHPIDRADTKFSIQMGAMPAPVNQTPANRRMIISAETVRSDQLQDQVKAASFHGLQYIPAAPGFISSTTEPAIPILRLSNEMDLDGSYSYEALGADQTHYVQHSRMENMGTDKEEQVVEGSYSYVGDNGQTYTVHYVADANGFRASGDHLPVAPPVPEIIQRAVQYNLAEEAKRPPHLKSSWEDDTKQHDYTEKSNYGITPSRGLFTGKAPEAFSYNFAQGSNLENNNLVAAASNQAPVKTVDFVKDQSQNKPNTHNGGSITPQITFLASQGAHVPSLNTAQQSISRMFSNSEKTAMPQLINYGANIKENEQDNNNKALWRWQYGIHANNETPAKNTISRSFGEGDDIMINFNDMTQEEYTNMIKSQLEPSETNNQAVGNSQFVRYTEPEAKEINKPYDGGFVNTQKPMYKLTNYDYHSQVPQSVSSVNVPYSNNWYSQNFNANNFVQSYDVTGNRKQDEVNKINAVLTTPKPFVNFLYNSEPNKHSKPVVQQDYVYTKAIPKTSNEYYIEQMEKSTPAVNFSQATNIHYNNNIINTVNETQTLSDSDKTDEIRQTSLTKLHQNIITQKHFIPRSQVVTQSYDYEENYYEPKRVKSFNNNKLNTRANETNKPAGSITTVTSTTSSNWHLKNNIDFKTENIPMSSTELSHVSSAMNGPKFIDFIIHEKNDDFKPIIISNNQSQDEKDLTTTSTTTETSVENLFQNNIFLKGLIKTEKSSVINKPNAITEEPKRQIESKVHQDAKVDKTPKFMYSNPINDNNVMKKKPFEISDVLNYVSHKNLFESGKIRPKSKPVFQDNSPQRKEPYHSTIQEERQEEKQDFRKGLNLQQQEELRGIIKNYKVLHRNNNIRSEQNNNMRFEPNSSLRTLQVQSSNLPPLGRAGPSIKTYLPPIYV